MFAQKEGFLDPPLGDFLGKISIFGANPQQQIINFFF